MKRNRDTRVSNAVPGTPKPKPSRYRPATAREIENFARFMNAQRVHSPKQRAS